MNDFEYSVEICDRDWECFFAECEECNLCPPSLAGLDDSGMSDIDETGSIIAKRVQKVNPIEGFSEADHPIDGPPDCEGSPVENYLSKHGIGGMESVLSGSEEDIHLQSVNIFFERLKDVTEAEPSQVRAGKNRAAIQEEQRCSDGKQASSSTLPENIPKLNSLPARGETAIGKETTEPVDTSSNINTMKKDEPDSNVFPEPSNLVLKTNKSAHPETKLFIREEACTETRVNEATQWKSHDSADGLLYSEITPDKVIKVEMWPPLSSTESWNNLDMETNVSVLQSDTSNKTASQESSPSASIKRKRRKKRRLSVEPAESVQGYERQVLVKKSDSEEEKYAWKGGTGLCVSEDINSFYLNEPQKHVTSLLTTYSATSNLPVKISAKVNDLSQYSRPCESQYIPESIARQGRYKATEEVENNVTNDRFVTPLSPTENSVMSAPNNGVNGAAGLQPCSKLQLEESAGLNKYPGLPVLINDSVNSKSNLITETANCGRKEAHTGSLQLSDKMNNFRISCGNGQNPACCAAEVKPVTHSILPSAESNDPTVEVSQKDKLSAAKSVLAVEAGNTGRDNHILCQREPESQQQLEMDCHSTDQYSSTLEKTHFPLSATGLSSSHNTRPRSFKTTTCPFLEETSSQVDCAELTLDTSNSLPDKHYLSKCPLSLENKQTEHQLVLDLASKFDVLSEKNSTAERAELSGEMNSKSQSETNSSLSEDLTSPPDTTPVSSCYALDTEYVMSLSNENITDISGRSCLSGSENDSGGQGEQTSVILATHKEEGGTSKPITQSVSNDSTDLKCDLVVESEDAVTSSKAECGPEKAPDSKQSVFAMSSFWSEMEKLTINDILGLRMISKAAPPNSLPPLQESEETDMFAMTDSESKPEQANDDTSSNPNSVESSSGSVMADDSSSSRGVLWDSEPVPMRLAADIYPENLMLTSFKDTSQPVLPGSAQTCLRKISKNVSVHNLHALESESFDYAWKGQTLQTLDEGGLEKEYFADGHVPKQDKECEASSLTDSYRISLTDIYQYLFGGKQSIPSQSATDEITPLYTDGNSVPETYDHFFSEFDTESFFYPLITAEDQAEDELVPIFSCSRSASGGKLQYPEAYDYFFASSSSDDSSGESDEEDNCSPVRVVSRFSRTSSAPQMSGDIYENFFTESDLRQNFFWKTTLSFRNISFTGSAVQKQTLSHTQAVVPVRQSGRSLRRTVPKNVLGNQDMMFPDPLLYHLEDRISRQLQQQPFRYEDFQTAVSNPRLDASLLPLRQSDMCLVCIAFASWVLKTANPQVGDAWKAVLLANVSALSAIRYLRKYVKMEAAASQKKLQYTALSDS